MANSSTVYMRADSAYGQSGQYIARITGRDPKFQFTREFVGRKIGKRGECTELRTDETGLYETCDKTKNGKDSSFYIVWLEEPGILTRSELTHEEALLAARQLEEGESTEVIGLTDLIQVVKSKLADEEAKPADTSMDLSEAGQRRYKLPEKTTAGDLVQARRAWLAKIDAPVNDKNARVAQVQALMASLGVTINDLSAGA